MEKLNPEMVRILAEDNNTVINFGNESNILLRQAGVDWEQGTRLVLALRQRALENMLKFYPWAAPTDVELALIDSQFNFSEVSAEVK
jgi:hypothetical protein